MSSFGAELRSRRLGAGLSLNELRKLTFYSRGYLSKLENGLKPPTDDVARRCDTVLGAGGALTALVPPRRRKGPAESRAARPPAGPPDGLPVLGPDFGDLEFGPGPGLEFGPGLGLEFGPGRGEAVGWERAAEVAAGDDRSLDMFAAAFDQCRSMGHQFSPHLVLGSLRSYTGWLRLLAEQARDPVLIDGFRLLGARYAEYGGWMAQEAGDDAAAQAWTRLAASWARAARDAELPWCAHIRAAEIALYRADPERMISVSRLAQLDAPARVRGMAAQREAQGHALLGDRGGYERALDAAEIARAAVVAEDPPTRWPEGGGTSVADPLMITRAWSLYDLGRPAEAADILDREVPRISPNGIRARARYGLRQALAHVAAGNLEHACALLNSLITDIARADSATIRVDLRRAVHELSRWRTDAAVADLLPRLSAVLRAG